MMILLEPSAPLRVQNVAKMHYKSQTSISQKQLHILFKNQFYHTILKICMH